MVDATHQHPSRVTIEVCVDSVESAVSAVRGGADRLELCGNLSYGGGTTPSIGLLQSVQKAVPNVPIMAMVRPRTGDFVYSEEEMDVMLHDISIFKEYGVQGIVLGVLTAAGDVDESLVRKLISAAAPLEVCFHRAFDMVSDPKKGIVEHAIQCDWYHKDTDEVMSSIKAAYSPGCSTQFNASGQCRDVCSPEALGALAWMLDSAGHLPMGVVPGSGITVSTIPVLCKALLSHGLKEIHLSGGRWVEGRSAYRRDGMGMGEWSIWKTDEEVIKKVREFIDRFCATEAGEACEM